MKRIINSLLLLQICFWGFLQLAATPITQQQAQQNVQTFLESKGLATKASTLRLSKPKFTSSNIEYYYVFNIGDHGGYVIAAGDDCAPAILGYADSGSVNVDSMPENMKAWLEEYATQIEYMQEHQLVASPKLTTSYNAISPLLTTTWDQLDPYNQNCPDFFGYGKCVTGCVATAMAQVMYYHRANSVTQTTAQIPAYDCRTLWLNGSDTLGHIHVDAIPAGSPIDWGNMLNSYGSSATAIQKEAVANLMKYCGASVSMNYANEWDGGSGAYSTDVPVALKAYFNYSNETVLKNRSDYSSNDAWESLIYNELSNSRPVYYSGRNSSGGHAFVCDGYDGSGYYHINWGWSGTSDGYFLLTALDPNQQGTGGSSSGYNQNQAALINAQPRSSTPPPSGIGISFADVRVKVLCVQNWDTNGDGELSEAEAAAVTDLGSVFKNQPSITSFDELQYFTGLTVIGSFAFSNCSGLTSIIIPSSVTTIGQEAFNNCSGLTSIVIPSSVTSIDSWELGTSFRGCTSLSSITIDPNNTVYDSRGNCNAVIKKSNNALIVGCKNTVIPSSVTTINQAAFYNCSSLTSVTIPNSVTSIGEWAFRGCSGLTSITIPSSVTTIGNNAFVHCSGLTSIKVNSNNTVYDSRGNCNAIIKKSNNELILGCKNTIIPSNVTTIGSYAFVGCSGLTSIIIPSNVTTIGDYAFSYCSSLTNVTIGNSVTNIGYQAFYNCSSLTSIDIPNSVTSIGGSAFYGTAWYNNQPDGLVYAGKVAYKYKGTMPAGTSIILADSTLGIAGSAFNGCYGLTSINIPNSVTSIGNSAFSGCSGLTDLIWNAKNCTSNGDMTTSNIESVTIGNEVEVIPSGFVYGSKIVSVTIPNSVTSIRGSAFSSCSGLTSVTIPNSVTSIGGSAFYDCTALDTLNFNAVSCADFSSYSYPFENTIISTINIGENVQKIPAYLAKGNIRITSVTIPNSVTAIGNGAFNGCSSLNDVFSFIDDPTTVSMGSNVFYRNPSNYATRTLHVPNGTSTAYQTNTKWSNYFGSIVEMGILATSISLNKTSAAVIEGNTLQLTATVMPTNASNRTVTWKSSNTSVATVNSSGLVTAKSPGSATITATTIDGTNLSATCAVTVATELIDFDNYLSINDAEALHGDTIVIPVAMTNAESIISFQTDVFLPEGLEIVQENGDYLIDPSNRITRTHSIMSNEISSGAVRVLCYSSNYKPFTGNSGDDLFYITVKVSDDAEGDYIIQLKNTLLTNTDFVDLAAPDVAATVNVKAYLLGDANNSGTVTITDVVVTAQYVLEMNPSPFIFAAADVNFDNNITVADVSRIAWMVLNPSMNAPRRAPALWNNGDSMSGEDITLNVGETRTVSIVLDNEMDYSAFQFDLSLPEGLTAGNFRLTNRAGSHAFDVNTLANGKTRALCYSPTLTAIRGNEGAVLTFDVTATTAIDGVINVDGIELVTTDCQTVRLDAFAIGVNNATSMNEIAGGKTVARVDYFNLAGQQIDRPESGVTLVVTTYTDGTRTTTKVIQ